MSLITHFEGDVKSGKTLSGIYWTKRLARRMGLDADHIFTNMESLVYRGMPWATTVDLDDILVDILITDIDRARYKYGVLFLDEVHTLWSGQLLNSLRGQGLIAFIAQAGKRGLIVVYTSHITGMIAPKVVELTQRRIYCETPNEGRVVFWDVHDPRAERIAAYRGQPLPPAVPKVLTRGTQQYGWYDPNEIIDPFASHRAMGASKGGRAYIRQLEKKLVEREAQDAERYGPGVERALNEPERFKGIPETEQRAIAGMAETTRREIMESLKDPRAIWGERR